MSGRKPIVHDNTAVMKFLQPFFENGVPMIAAVPAWVENCVAGQRCHRGTRPSSTAALLNALYQMDTISFETVKKFVNKKSIAVDEREYSDSHCYSFFIRLRMASKAIEFYYERKYGTSIFAHIV